MIFAYTGYCHFIIKTVYCTKEENEDVKNGYLLERMPTKILTPILYEEKKNVGYLPIDHLDGRPLSLALIRSEPGRPV